MNETLIRLKNIEVKFRQKDQVVTAVDHVNLDVKRGQIYGIVGYSGAGKSTLVRVINLLQRPTNSDAQVWVKGEDLVRLSQRDLQQRRRKIGMIFQHFNLMHSLTVGENVRFALKTSSLSKQEQLKRVNSLLELVGLSGREQDYPAQLSGGQKQRVAIARALANEPDILISDEATSALDPKTTAAILDLLADLNRRLGLTIVLITHEMEAVKRICQEVAVMEAGKIIETGSVFQLFTHPQAHLTQEFVATASPVGQALQTVQQQPIVQQLTANQWLVQLQYVGASTDQPLLTQLYAQFKVSANILFGNVEILQGTSIGNLVVVLSGTSLTLNQAVSMLKEHEVEVKVLKTGGNE